MDHFTHCNVVDDGLGFDGEPLDRLQVKIIKDGVVKFVPALHQGWVEKMSFIQYVPPPTLSTCSEEDIEIAQVAWIDAMTFLLEDLNWLLQLPHHRFWSQIIYDVQVRKSLNSYLSQAARYFDTVNPYLTNEMKKMLEDIAKSVFFIHLRMATYKESKSCHITPAVFGEMIYDNFLFDIPKIMDLCILYSHGNIALLQKIIENIFKCQPKYYEDLANVVPSIVKALENVQSCLCSNDKSNKECDKNIISLMQLDDYVSFLLDICATLSAFIEVHKDAYYYLNEHDVALRLAKFYDEVVPVLQTELQTKRNWKGTLKSLKKKLSIIKNSCLKIFRSFIVGSFLQPLMELSKESGKQADQIDSLLSILITEVSHTNFVKDYFSK